LRAVRRIHADVAAVWSDVLARSHQRAGVYTRSVTCWGEVRWDWGRRHAGHCDAAPACRRIADRHGASPHCAAFGSRAARRRPPWRRRSWRGIRIAVRRQTIGALRRRVRTSDRRRRRTIDLLHRPRRRTEILRRLDRADDRRHRPKRADGGRAHRDRDKDRDQREGGRSRRDGWCGEVSSLIPIDPEGEPAQMACSISTFRVAGHLVGP